MIAVASVDRSWAQEFSPDTTEFTVAVRDVNVRYRVFAIYVLPGTEIPITVLQDDHGGSYTCEASAGLVQSSGGSSWVWTAPTENGLSTIVILGDGVDSLVLNAFVLLPLDLVEDGYLNEYRIGEYPKQPYKGLPVYEPPDGFVEVTPENADTPLSPHFTLRQFLCKQNGDWPKYVVLRELLLLKLEMVLQKANEQGYACPTFHVMSGYRTPYYNKSIGNVKYSRHQWGGAADIFIDVDPQDELMDDLNEDGTINWKDAAILYDIIDDLYGHPSYEPFVGGLARYKKTANHGPFVHLDVRGFRARWGD